MPGRDPHATGPQSAPPSAICGRSQALCCRRPDRGRECHGGQQRRASSNNIWGWARPVARTQSVKSRGVSPVDFDARGNKRYEARGKGNRQRQTARVSRPAVAELRAWMGTGLASSLPFHVAGDHSAGWVANMLSCAISSYTPTIKALRYAREKTRRVVDGHSILLVTIATTPGEQYRSLPGVEVEGRDIRSVVNKPHSVKPLPQPTADAVLENLKGSSIAHFACHGSADLLNPSNSFLALQGESESTPDKLTVKMISNANLSQAWLAYLSACSTAEIRVSDLADEALHLASSFQVAGFRHVVASMWPSDDTICAQVAKLFYEELLANGGVKAGDRAVPAALQAAVLQAQLQNLERPHLWAQYIHSGA
ncbi:CHAT domain-containing protein [Phaeosphaeriaceae sp. PMI808]|nr:CHAT domain-containing protein [Phaeosphaeriaceae sp. PMI808]